MSQKNTKKRRIIVTETKDLKTTESDRIRAKAVREAKSILEDSSMEGILLYVIELEKRISELEKQLKKDKKGK